MFVSLRKEFTENRDLLLLALTCIHPPAKAKSMQGKEERQRRGENQQRQCGVLLSQLLCNLDRDLQRLSVASQPPSQLLWCHSEGKPLEAEAKLLCCPKHWCTKEKLLKFLPARKE